MSFFANQLGPLPKEVMKPTPFDDARQGQAPQTAQRQAATPQHSAPAPKQAAPQPAPEPEKKKKKGWF